MMGARQLKTAMSSRPRSLSEFAARNRRSINPAKFPDEEFDLFSIPAYEAGRPEEIRGAQIGSSKILVEPGDVLISKIVPHIQRVWIVPERNGKRQIASGEWIVFRGEDVAPEFLRHMLLTKPFHLQFMQTVAGMGGSLLRARPSEVVRIEIPVPHAIEEQRRIAAILDLAAAVRRKHEKMLTLADSLLKSVFLEMFGDPVINPRGWPLVTLEELGDVQGGLQVSKKRDILNFRRPYLRVANVYRDRLDLSEVKEIGLTQSEFSRAKLESGDVLIVEGHGNPDEIGRSSVWNGLIADCVHQNHLIRFRADRQRLSPTYLSRLLNSDGGKLQLIAAGRTTSGLNTISTRKVKEVRIPLPPIEEQQRFADIVQSQATAAANINFAIEATSTLFGCLSERAFRGEL